MIRQLPNLSDNLEEGKLKGQVPWSEVVREDFHVVVFKDKGMVTTNHLIFVPQYATVSLIQDCLKDAYAEGMRKVEAGEWKGFVVNLDHDSTITKTPVWPHVRLIPVTNDTTN